MKEKIIVKRKNLSDVEFGETLNNTTPSSVDMYIGDTDAFNNYFTLIWE